MKQREIVGAINSLISAAKQNMGQEFDAKNAVTGFVAHYVAVQLTLPSEAVANPKDYYVQNVYMRAVDMLGKINECYAININAARDCVYSMWLLRYSIVHQPFTNEGMAAMSSALQESPLTVADAYTAVVKSCGSQYVSYLKYALDQAAELHQ